MASRSGITSSSDGGSMAPSALAHSSLFAAWANGAQLRRRGVPLGAATAEFVQLTRFQLPKHFTTKPKTFSVKSQAEFYAKLKEWASHNKESVYNRTEDPDKLRAVSSHLSVAYSVICDAVDQHASESAQRRGVDSLIQLAFAIRVTAKHDFAVRFEQDLQVCRSAWRDRRVGSKAIVDTVVVKTVPGEKMDQLSAALDTLGLTAANRYECKLCLFWTPDPTTPNTVILFLGEFQKAEGGRNQNQLVLDFATAQNQRRCLGLPNRVIWGITYANGKLDVYSAMWTDTEPPVIAWSHHQTWNLTVPIELLRFYSFLCKLSDKLVEMVDALAAIDAATAVQTAKDVDWRPSESDLMPPRQAPPLPRTNQSGPQPMAGPSGRVVTEEPEYMDVEELVGGGCGLSEREGSMSDSDREVEGDDSEELQRKEAIDMPPEEGHVYRHLHGLVRDPDWWQPYMGVK